MFLSISLRYAFRTPTIEQGVVQGSDTAALVRHIFDVATDTHAFVSGTREWITVVSDEGAHHCGCLSNFSEIVAGRRL